MRVCTVKAGIRPLFFLLSTKNQEGWEEKKALTHHPSDGSKHPLPVAGAKDIHNSGTHLNKNAPRDPVDGKNPVAGKMKG